MFDFIRKRLNKTIKDASDEVEEDLEQLPENVDEVQSEEPESSGDSQDKPSDDDESSDDDKKDEDKPKKKSRFSFFSRNKDKDEKEEDESSDDEVADTEDTDDVETDDAQLEDTTQKEDEEEPQIDEPEEEVVVEEEVVEEEEDESSDDDVTDDEKEETKSEKKGFFSFLSRNKNKDKEEEEPQDEKDESEDEESQVDETPDIDESEEVETVKEESQDEDKSSDDGKKTVKYEGEVEGGRFSFISTKTIKEDDIEEILEDLEMSLIEGDVAFEVAETIVEDVKEDLIGRKIKRKGDMELFTTNALKKSIRGIIDNGTYDLIGDIEAAKAKGEPYKIMFVGINGTGKTTTIAKLATYLKKHGYTSVFGASDTFRAGAIEQLEHHANNLDLKIIKHSRNSDPAAVAYDAVDHAKTTGKDVVLIDTSGRMQTNANLMDEMKKIKRISKPDIVVYVGDALMGNDATEQATKFDEVIDLDGIILTKTDADAKGGAALSIGHVIHKPILFIGVGQGYDDLIEFDPDWMINKIFGEDEDE